jgi:zinc transporter ZupT
MGEETPAGDGTDDPGAAAADRPTDGVVATTARPLGLPRWVAALVPVLVLLAVVGLFVFASPLAGVESGEPLPDVTVTHATMPNDETVVLHVTNDGPASVTVSQVLVDEAYWEFRVEGSGGDRTLQPRENAQVVIPYHWTPGWDLAVDLMLADGTTVGHTIVAPQQSPGTGASILWTLALVGVFVGVIPVLLGMLWFPFIRSMSNRALHALLLFAAGVLAFLAFDAAFEAFELAERIPGAYDGPLVVVLGVVGALLTVQAVSAWREGRVDAGDARAESGLRVAYLVALAIGLHNLAEGLAIGSSFALGRVSLGAFLVVGFMLHNVTEGPAVVAPVADGERPALRHFLALGLLAGAPVILGGWIGGVAFSPTLGAFFLAIGVGAILQVDWELARLVRAADGRVATATNLLAFLVGFVVMYATDIFVVL